jgi:colanic acid/amylovoran biosynthesis glycosyltransferase
LNHDPDDMARKIRLAGRVGIGFAGPVSMSRPVVASYCTTFLKPEMLHIFRQVCGLARWRTFVVTRERACAERFPFGDIEVLPPARQPLLRRFWLKFVARVPPLHYRGELGQLTDLFARRPSDLLHVYFGHTGVHLRDFLRARSGPSVVSFHGADVMLREHRPKYAAHMRSLFPLVPLVLVRSRSLADRVESAGCPPEKIRLNRTGIPLGEFPFVPRRAPADGAWRLVQACRLIEKKGLRTALGAFARFRGRFPRAAFVIAGDGPMRGELEALASAPEFAGSVSFAGFLGPEDLRSLYARSHIFLHPSETTGKQDQEGVPNSMLEAMATGLPVAATIHGGIPEAVDDGHSGILVPEKSPEALADALVRMVSFPDSLAEMGSSASRAVRERFEQSRAIEALERIYDEAVALGKPAQEGVR